MLMEYDLSNFIDGELLSLFGGGTVIILAMSAWLGKLWSKRIIQNEKSNLDKKLESQKALYVANLEVTKAELTEKAKLFEHRLNTISQKRFDAITENYELLADVWLQCRWAIQSDELGRDKPPAIERMDKAALALDTYFHDFEKKKLYLSDTSQKSVYSFLTSVWESLTKLRVFAQSNDSHEQRLKELYDPWIHEHLPKLNAARSEIEAEYKYIIGVDKHNKQINKD